MRKTASLVLSIALPVAALAATGLSGLVERVPALPANAQQLAAALPKIEAAAAALSRDIEAKQEALNRELAANATAMEAAGRQQMRSMSGMSDEELDEADDEEVANRMLGQMGLSMEDLDKLEEMDDEEGAAWAQRKAAGGKGLARMTAPTAISGAEAERMTRLLTEAGDRFQNHQADVQRASQAYADLTAQIDRDHAQLDARLDTEQAPKRKAVRMVDCGEAGDYPDARELHALALERARAHVALAPGHLDRVSAYLDQRRAAARDNAAFAERMVVETRGIPSVAGQADSAQSIALSTTHSLLIETVDLARKIADWEARKTHLEQNPPKSTCG